MTNKWSQTISSFSHGGLQVSTVLWMRHPFFLILRSSEWQFRTEVSGQLISPIIKRMIPIICAKTSCTNYRSTLPKIPEKRISIDRHGFRLKRQAINKYIYIYILKYNVNQFVPRVRLNLVPPQHKISLLTLRLLMSYIYGAPILDVSRSHTTTQHSR